MRVSHGLTFTSEGGGLDSLRCGGATLPSRQDERRCSKSRCRLLSFVEESPVFISSTAIPHLCREWAACEVMEGRADAAEAAPTVLVTGANGFLGSHCVWLLLHCGFNVRGTSRNIDSARSEELLNLVDTLQLPSHRFELVASDDLGDGGGWRALLQGCKYCIHTACPDLMYEMADASAVVAPAVIGARSLLMVR